MNVNDIILEKMEGDKLELIFARQNELKKKYHHIEESQGVGYGLLQGGKFNINEIRSQCLLKDLGWRVVEEITEATEAQYIGDDIHFKEELADALHFLTELCIQVGITPDMIVEDVKGYPDKLGKLVHSPTTNKLNSAFGHSNDPYITIYFIGLAMNCLKQKPWKRTHILTDQKKFIGLLIEAYKAFCKYFGRYCKPDEIFDFYFKKSKVNDFRIKSNY